MNPPDIHIGLVEIATVVASGCIGSIIIFTLAQLPGLYRQWEVMDRERPKLNFSDAPLPEERPALDPIERLGKQAKNNRRK